MRVLAFFSVLLAVLLWADPAAAQSTETSADCPGATTTQPVDPAATPVCSHVAPQHHPDGIALPDGRFYTQATGNPRSGFAVTDDHDAHFWTEFQRLGGVPAVGYPISQRFVWNGFVSQAFQKLILQWRPDEGRAAVVNVIDVLHERDLDGWLQTFHATPPVADWTTDRGRAWPEVVAAHQALLTDPDLRAAYFAVADPITHYGLPMAPIDDAGGVLVLRAQRAILQKWLTDTPWARAGQVTVANGGDLAKEAGLLPNAALQPQPALPPTLVPSGELRSLRLNLEVAPQVTTGEPVRLTLRVTNPTDETISWWTGMPVADFLVVRDGAEYWRWSAGKAFIAIAQLIELAPGESLVEEQDWPVVDDQARPAAPGDYQAIGMLTAAPTTDDLTRPIPLQSAPVTVTVR